MPHAPLTTPRLDLVPITLEIVEAFMADDRPRAEQLLGATLPKTWPGRAVIERNFSARLEMVRASPDVRLWGDRVMLSRSGPRRLIGSVVFHGAPGEDGLVEVAYGVEQESQSQGYATEGVLISVEWALRQPGVRSVLATTPSWHRSSQRVLEKCGFVKVGERESEMMVGELYEYERIR